MQLRDRTRNPGAERDPPRRGCKRKGTCYKACILELLIITEQSDDKKEKERGLVAWTRERKRITYHTVRYVIQIEWKSFATEQVVQDDWRQEKG